MSLCPQQAHLCDSYGDDVNTCCSGKHPGERTRAHYGTNCSSVLRPIAPAPLFSLGLHTPLFLSMYPFFVLLLLLVANVVHMQVAQLYPSNSLKRIVNMFRAISGHVMTRRTAFTIERTCHHPTRPVGQCPSSPGAGDKHKSPTQPKHTPKRASLAQVSASRHVSVRGIPWT